MLSGRATILSLMLFENAFASIDSRPSSKNRLFRVTQLLKVSFSIFFIFFGMLIYYVFVGKLVISVSECIAFFLKVVFLYLAFFISRPFLLLYRKIKAYFQKIKSRKKNNKKSVEKIEKHRCEVYKIGKYEF